MTGKWIVCKRDGREMNPRKAVPVRIANVTSQAGLGKFNKELTESKKEYAFFESYYKYFLRRGINLDTLPTVNY